jgi:hypothetical protein
MKQDFYSYKSDSQELIFEFESISQEKTIQKIIAYLKFLSPIVPTKHL